MSLGLQKKNWIMSARQVEKDGTHIGINSRMVCPYNFTAVVNDRLGNVRKCTKMFNPKFTEF